ncbi:MAG TPA: YgjP-like metallopeptidase domain-containing protein [Candidatus Saccharimonadales bacterium]|nr:YgjP-like metallopeptidase domain-containing protein [Candidatus Saccharimonadales bacterium]
MATKQIELANIGTVVLYKRRGNRSLRLSIGSAGEIRVSMPYWLPYKAGEQFAVSKAAWIALHRTPVAAGLHSGQAVGKAHRLLFSPSARASKAMARIKDNQIEVSYPEALPLDAPEVQKAARTAAIRALRREAEQLLPLRLRQLAGQNGFTFHSVAVKQLKSRWGSCSTHQDIILNLFLMQLPWHLIDYVLLHELTHTKVMQHGAPFWQELERHVPHAKRLRKEIGEYHPVLAAQ